MRAKKILIPLSISLAVSIPVITAIVIAAKPDNPTPSSTYSMSYKINKKMADNFSLEEKNKFAQNQKYIDFLKSQVNSVINEYKKLNKSFKDLELDFIYLLKNPGSGQVNFFNELNKALMDINPALKFKMLQRNNITQQQGAINKNVDMVTFYWTPDYNDVGTWMTYMFSEFQIANLWPAIVAIYNQNSIPTDSPYFGPWIDSLKNELKNNFILDSNKNKHYLIDSSTNKALTMEEIYNLASNDSKLSVNSMLSIIGNAISAWTNNPENKMFPNSVSLLPENDSPWYENYTGGLSSSNNKDIKTPLSSFLDYLNSFNPNIPFVQDGPNSQTISLVKNGAHVPNNPETSYNARDWYYEDGVYLNGAKFIDWTKANPFESTTTPFNPCFTRLSNSNYMSSIFSPLFSWSSYGDFYTENDQSISKINANLVAVGSNDSVKDIQDKIEQFKTNPSDNMVVEIPIRPLVWVNSSGNSHYSGDKISNYTSTDKYESGEYYLSPADYRAGFQAYLNSIKVGLNHNDYFIELGSIDIEKTIADSANFERNLSTSDNKVFRLHLTNPIQLSAFNIIDILSMQYFTALPAFEPTVRNIIDPEKFKSITGINLNPTGDEKIKPIDPTASYMSNFYGCGDHRDAWKNLWSTSAYYISNVNDQTYTYKLNPKYFEAFKDYSTPEYNSFKLETTFNDKIIKKFDTIEFKYAAKYNVQVAFEQFKTGEIQRSDIPPSEKANVLAPNSVLKPDLYLPKVLKVGQSDLVPYNLQVFETNNGVPKIIDKNGNEVNDFDYTKLTSDKYGNLVFPEGYMPKLKSKISNGYYDLIVKNFYTPIDAKDENGNLLPVLDRSSAIIRTAINDCINWFSLTSIVFPNETKTMQNSFMPYGVANLLLHDDSQPDSSRVQTKYWNLAAYKVGQEEYVNNIVSCEDFEKGIIRNTPGGIVEWTWLDYITQWKYKLEGKII